MIPPAPTLTVRTLAEPIADLVRDRILSGAVPAGEQIRQDALAAELGVSKIPLREALARLAQEGLVEAHANRGFFVRALDFAEAEEVYALRVGLEPELTAAAAMRAGETERRAAAKALDGSCEPGAGNRAFHLALLRPAARPVTLSILERLHILSERYVAKHLEPLGRNARAVEEHQALLDAWLARDAEHIVALSRTHIAKTLDDLRQQLVASDEAAAA